jgi:hypothetical protein
MRTFSLLNLTDVKLGLDDLLASRHAALLSTQAGQGCEEVLRFQHKELAALPHALTGGRPFAEDLAVTDAEHDEFGLGIWHVTEAYLRVPGVHADVRDAARRVRAAFIPDPARLRDTYAEEAAAAGPRKIALETLEDDLKRLPIAGGRTLYDWARGFVRAAERIAQLLSQRAEVNSHTRKHALTLRSETISILNDLRKGLEREAARNPALPKDIDAQIFGLFDTLEDSREAASRGIPSRPRLESISSELEGQ